MFSFWSQTTSSIDNWFLCYKTSKKSKICQNSNADAYFSGRFHQNSSTIKNQFCFTPKWSRIDRDGRWIKEEDKYVLIFVKRLRFTVSDPNLVLRFTARACVSGVRTFCVCELHQFVLYQTFSRILFSILEETEKERKKKNICRLNSSFVPFQIYIFFLFSFAAWLKINTSHERKRKEVEMTKIIFVA